MRTVKCNDCGGTVSKLAKACPHCGSTYFSFRKSANKVGCQLVVIGVILWLLLTLCGII